jgi:hypothetical protein
MMRSLGHDVIANTAWFEKKAQEHKQVFFIFVTHQDSGELLGTSVFTWSSTTHMVTSAFRATQRINLIAQKQKGSLGFLLDLLFLREALALRPHTISAGRSRNAFGIVNSFGYLNSKLQTGMRPHISGNEQLLQTTPTPPPGKDTAFFGKTDAGVTFFVLHAGEVWNDTLQLQRFAGKTFCIRTVPNKTSKTFSSSTIHMCHISVLPWVFPEALTPLFLLRCYNNKVLR